MSAAETINDIKANLHALGAEILQNLESLHYFSHLLSILMNDEYYANMKGTTENIRLYQQEYHRLKAEIALDKEAYDYYKQKLIAAGGNVQDFEDAYWEIEEIIF